MTFKDLMAMDAGNMINPNELGEQVAYTPYGGAAVNINAVIDRGGSKVDEQAQGRVLGGRCELFISRVDVPVVTKNSDVVRFPAIIGGVSSDWRVSRIIDHDVGMWHIEVRE